MRCNPLTIRGLPIRRRGSPGATRVANPLGGGAEDAAGAAHGNENARVDRSPRASESKVRAPETAPSIAQPSRFFSPSSCFVISAGRRPPKVAKYSPMPLASLAQSVLSIDISSSIAGSEIESPAVSIAPFFGR